MLSRNGYLYETIARDKISREINEQYQKRTVHRLYVFDDKTVVKHTLQEFDSKGLKKYEIRIQNLYFVPIRTSSRILIYMAVQFHRIISSKYRYLLYSMILHWLIGQVGVGHTKYNISGVVTSHAPDH